jgi:AcrR family transcriptional regulator
MDAQRNRERILEVAKKAFTRFGADASLDDIARQASVPERSIVTFPRATR